MLTNCALEEPQVIEDLDGLRSAFYMYALMETVAELPGTPETEDLFRSAHQRLSTHIEESGLDAVTLSRIAEMLSVRQRSNDP